jgi:hypothetical protein
MGQGITARVNIVVAVWLAIGVNVIDPSSSKFNIKNPVKPAEQLVRNPQAIMSSRML